jgi:hypothetical protein
LRYYCNFYIAKPLFWRFCVVIFCGRILAYFATFSREKFSVCESNSYTLHGAFLSKHAARVVLLSSSVAKFAYCLSIIPARLHIGVVLICLSCFIITFKPYLLLFIAIMLVVRTTLHGALQVNIVGCFNYQKLHMKKQLTKRCRCDIMQI